MVPATLLFPPGAYLNSRVERQNLTMRMGMRRSARLMNAFSKRVETYLGIKGVAADRRPT
jgi:hypothetical protein